MWIMTNSGFLSVVAHRDQPNDLLVRARRKGEIETIFPGADISRTPDADYLYRSVISRTEVSSVLARQIQPNKSHITLCYLLCCLSTNVWSHFLDWSHLCIYGSVACDRE